ncbi:hypothetical protein [Halyomorpha halys erranti-like virus 1]|nr:hypothetical protein [Halyomorpha halys erranti-like virus 1]
MCSIFNVDFLRKSDLVFELRIRGLKYDGNVDALRKSLRLALAQNVIPNKHNLSVDSIPEEVDLCKSTLQVLYDDFENLGEAASRTDVVRFRDRLSCFSNRVALVNEFCETLSRSDLNTEIEFCVDECKRMMISFNGSYPASSPKPNINPVTANFPDRTDPAPLETNPSSSTKHTLPAPFIFNNNNPNVSDKQPNTQLLSMPNCNVSAEPPTIQPQNPVNFPTCYSKLKHPAEESLSRIPFTDGLCVEQILNFFRTTLRIISAFPDLKPQIFSLLIPQTSGAFRNLILLHQGSNDFNAFHQAAINSFIPARQLNDIVKNLFLRKQGQSEKLSQYISDIKESAAVLLLNMTEREVVDIILEGINFKTRSCATFCCRPTSYAELDRLCIEILNVDFVHRNEDRTGGNPRTSGQFTNIRTRPAGNSSVTCHHCRRAGHIRPNCPDLRRRQSKNE